MALVTAQPLTETVMETRIPKQDRTFHYMQNFDAYKTGDLKYLELHKDYIAFYQKFVSEFDRKKKDLEFISENFVNQVFDKLAINLLKIEGPKVTLEISYENSIVFTLKKDGVTCFVEQFFDEDEELIFYSAYNLQNIKISYREGSIDSIISAVYSDLNK